MFVAWRDLRFARGRFVLIGSVVALITLLVGFLAGLTGGLASQNVSAVLDLPGDRLVLQQPSTGQPSFGDSTIGQRAVDGWQAAPGVDDVVPVGIVQGRATAPGAGSGAAGSGAAGSGAAASGAAVGVALVGLPTGARSTPVTDLAPGRDDQVGLSSGAAADLGVQVGDRITVTGTDYRVAVVGGDAWYSHTPVLAMTPEAWAAADRRLGGDGAPTVLAVSGSPDWDTVAASTGTSAASPLGSLTALETFRSEIGSLGLMIVMLFGVSALVVGAFFTVWTMQRAGDVAVLKALGASTGSLVRDALGQALVVLVLGIGVGMLAVVGLGALAGGALPFLLSPVTTVVPAAAMAVLGLAGAAVALRTVTSADPLTALGSNR
ncbi:MULTISPECIES: ABC transporter permease [unclassified Curtobacterium]|uniref:ABC transporter permease n=1 Tax=unclassified Curtobacterium TaxID=257496 RepID=UPI0010469FB2|nr:MULTISPECIES: ABC transporter permease [unclassified Curtobacterium]TCU48304.1 putative ABC transport system permease protein [Curtobacterium sp. PhB146]TCU83966.1 putative ABC transport system permease protein [Curtobacterium sp. PhB191]